MKLQKSVLREVRHIAIGTVACTAVQLAVFALLGFLFVKPFFAAFTGGKDDVTMGTYTLNTDMDYHALIAGMRSSSGEMNTNRLPSNWLSAAVREWTVRPNLRSPQKPMVK